MNTAIIESPVGRLRLTEEDDAITGIGFTDEACLEPKTPLLCRCAQELQAYFAGQRTVFTIPYRLPESSPFRSAVWRAMADIPYGCTMTYRQLAEKAGSERAARAAGGACHVNPIAIVVPCHRVIGSGGTLTGYAGGLDRKEWLLRLEQEHKTS